LLAKIPTDLAELGALMVVLPKKLMLDMPS
jgi:hypothetical protein